VTNSTTGHPTWSSPVVIGLFVAAGLTFLFFVFWEVKIVEYPVMPIEILNRRTPIAVAINNFTYSAVIFAQVRVVSHPLRTPKKVHVGIALHRPALLHYCPAFHPLERRPPPHPLPIPKHDHLHSLRHLRQISRELLLVDVCRRCLRASIVNTLIYLDFRDRRVSSLLGYLYDLEGLYVG